MGSRDGSHLRVSAHVPGEVSGVGDSRRRELKIIDEALAELRALVTPAPGLVVAEHVVHVGQAWRAIRAASETLDAHLIVIGSHCNHGLDHVLGTTAAKVVNLAHRNVFVVHCEIVVT